MKCSARRSSLIVTGWLLAMVLTSAFATTQLSKIVGGLVLNLGIMPAQLALRAEGHREAHPTNPPAGSQHLLVTLDDEKTGNRVGDAEVVVEVIDPHGRVEKKSLLHTQAGGLADYSELFEFRWSGNYSIRVTITPSPGAKAIEALFKIQHEV